MLIGVTSLVRRVKFLMDDNSSTILTSMGVAGTITTAYLSGRASFRAAQIIEQEQENLEKNLEFPETRADLSFSKKVKLVWRLYIPPFTMGVTTITCIVVANKIASKKIAALAVASGISERALQEYKAKVVEKLGERQDQKIRDEVAQDRVNKHPVGNREVIIAGTGEVLCYDMYSGRYFQSTVEEIKRAENKMNHDLNNFMHVSLSEFYDEIGLPPTSFSDNVGWNANSRVEVSFSAVLTPDQRPCMAIDFVSPPITDYHSKLLYD